MLQPLPEFASSSWREMLRDSIVRPRGLPGRLVGQPEELSEVASRFPMKLNSYFLKLIHSADDPIGRQVIPRQEELLDLDRDSDPLAEDLQSPVSQVIHRYPGRVVFLVSNQCAVHCRFCMRKRRVAEPSQVSRELIEEGIDYIGHHPQINEVILSGGDPLMRSDVELVRIMASLRRISHVGLLRIHTRMPVVLPSRITPTLVDQLSLFHPLYLNIHVNHSAEITPDVAAACGLMADAGIVLGSQSVLLKGINDNAKHLQELFEALLAIRVRPYYLHQLDRVPGTAHFQVPLAHSIDLVQALRGRLSGIAMPHLMVDLPGGGGKVALTGSSVVEKHRRVWRMRNWQGEMFDYPVGD